MAILSNPKHELFAQELAKGTSCGEAYVAAGYRANRGNAATLKAQQIISKRVVELQEHSVLLCTRATEKAAEALSIDKEWIMRSLQEDRLMARQNGQLAPAIRALELLGKELGMFIERSENRTVVHTVSSEPIAEEEWQDRHVAAH